MQVFSEKMFRFFSMGWLNYTMDERNPLFKLLSFNTKYLAVIVITRWTILNDGLSAIAMILRAFSAYPQVVQTVKFY
jgi:hypothetical protein